MSSLLDVKKAQQRLLSAFVAKNKEKVALADASGRVLADRIRADKDLPPFSNSSMDGFAVRSEDVKMANDDHPVQLAVIADVPAGSVVDSALGSGQAVRIMTGAPIPLGADAVVPVEATDFLERQPGTPAPDKVHIYKAIQSGGNVRLKGEDVRVGDTVIEPGRRLRPQDVGLLAMLGVAQVPVYCIPQVAILSAGDELLPITGELVPGKIYDSNAFTLISLVEKYGGKPLNLGIVPDQFEAIRTQMDKAVKVGGDFIISSDGVRVGAFDFVRAVVEEYGNLEFWRINMRPGKPLAFGSYKNTPFIGLPGNPVSAFVGFEVFARPAIMKVSGLLTSEHRKQRVMIGESIESDGRESYLRCIVTYQDGYWQARLTGHQGSGNLRSLVQANALLLVPSGVKFLPIGSELEAWILE
jgi:molybdopterin molybdotransferase